MRTDMALPNAQIYGFRLLLATMLVGVLVMAVKPVGHSLIFQLNDKFLHVAAFYTCALLVDFSFPHSKFGLKKTLPLLGYGLLIEVFQLQLGYRFFSLFDLLADAAGIVAYGLSLPLIRHLPILKGRWVGSENRYMQNETVD
jgi:VanZ family protein